MEGQLVDLTEEELKERILRWSGTADKRVWKGLTLTWDFWRCRCDVKGQLGLLVEVWTRFWRDRRDGFSSRIPVVKFCLGSNRFRVMFLPFQGPGGGRDVCRIALVVEPWRATVFFVSLFCIRWSCLFRQACNSVFRTDPPSLRLAHSSAERWKRKRISSPHGRTNNTAHQQVVDKDARLCIFNSGTLLDR